MASMRTGQILRAFACLLALAAVLAGCGDDDPATTSSAAEVENRPAPPDSAFPATGGRTMEEVFESAQKAELAVLPAARVYYTGQNRFPFGVFELDHTTVPDAEVALYASKVPKVNPKAEKPGAKGADARAQIKAREEPAIGPFPAEIETLATQPAFRAQTTNDEDATAVYVSQIDFPSEGEWRIAALVKEGDEISAALLPSVTVGQFQRVPKVGEKAPVIHTPTAEDVGGDLSQITTRVPPDTQNEVDFADVVGREPVVLLFATPQFCESRVCGPVVDVAEQVKQLQGEKAEFIHMEIWKENDPSTRTVRPQVKAYRLPTEPWLFVIDREGMIRTAIEGAFGVEALEEALAEVAG
jgi:hypothetical protein